MNLRKTGSVVAASCVLGCYLLLAFGCKPQSDGDVTATHITIGEVQAALQQRNFGEAATLADKLTDTNSQDPEAWLVAADAKAADGDRAGAFAALENAIRNGMRNMDRLDADTYLEPLRSSNEYRSLLVRFHLIKPVAQAGDTSIDETPSGTVVRAGDVSVTLPASR